MISFLCLLIISKSSQDDIVTITHISGMYFDQTLCEIVHYLNSDGRHFLDFTAEYNTGPVHALPEKYVLFMHLAKCLNRVPNIPFFQDILNHQQLKVFLSAKGDLKTHGPHETLL